MRRGISEHIRSDAVNKTINPEKQSRHILDSDGYVAGKSYLLDGVNAQELVDKYANTGRAELTSSGNWKNKETVTADMHIGVRVDPNTLEGTLTNRFVIHYSRTGTHIVPTKPLGR